MTDAFVIDQAVTKADLRATADLFQAYAASLPIDLAYQYFADELASLPGKYARPCGALLLARGKDKAPIGCVGLKGTDHGYAEIKRLWVAPAARGLRLGRRLMDAAENAARDLGITLLRLDTNSALAEAGQLYRTTGWREIPRFNDDPYPDLFFEKHIQS